MNLTNFTIWLLSKRQLSSRLKLPKRGSEMMFTPPRLLKWLPSSRSSGYRLLQCSVLQTTTSTQVAVVSPTHPTQAISPSLSFKLQDQVVLITGLSQKWLATSVLWRPRPTSQKIPEASRRFRMFRVARVVLCACVIYFCIASCHHAIMSFIFSSQLNKLCGPTVHLNRGKDDFSL